MPRGRPAEGSSSDNSDLTSRAGKVYHVKKGSQADPELFTDSAFAFHAKTTWARITSRRAVETYQGTRDHLVALIVLTAQTMAAISVAVAKQAWVLTVQFAQVALQVGGSVWKVSSKQIGKTSRSLAGGARATGGAIAGGSRATGNAVAGAANVAGSVVAGAVSLAAGAVSATTRGAGKAVVGSARVARGAVAGRRRTTREAGTGSVSSGAPVAGDAQRQTVVRPDGRGSTGPAPHSARPDAARATRQPAAGRPHPAAGRPQPAAGASRPVAGTARPAHTGTTTTVPLRPGAAGSGAEPRPAPTVKPGAMAPAAVTPRKGRAARGIPAPLRRSAAWCFGIVWNAIKKLATAPLIVWGWICVAAIRLSRVTGWAIRHWRVTLAPVALSTALLIVSPVGWDMVAPVILDRGSVGTPAREEAPQLADESEVTPSVSPAETSNDESVAPNLTLPKLSGPLVTLPKFSVQLPEFVKQPVDKVDALLNRPILQPNDRVVIADLTDRTGAAESLGTLLAISLEMELAGLSHVSVLPRERVLIASAGDGAGKKLSLRPAQAMGLLEATGAAAVITGELSQGVDGPAITLTLQDSRGSPILTQSSPLTDAGPVDAIARAAEALARRLGARPGSPTVDQPAASLVLPSSLDALAAFASARGHLFEGAYRSALSAAAAAVREDSSFAGAHQLMARAYGLLGQRARAKSALEAAWRHRDRLSERERLRVAADRMALDGKLSEAILAYDELFTLYRDDTAALKSQAILQEMIGARGGGAGNLRVASAIDPVDWPPLASIARYLGYKGRLPEVGPPPADSE